MTSLTYFTVTADFVPASAVGSLSGIVTFQMLVTQGDGLVAPTLTTPGIVVPTTTQGRITGGVLYGLDGTPGVSLLANTAVLNLSSTLHYQVSFADVVYTYPNSSAATQTVNLSAFTFAAETSAGTVDLSDVAPAAGALAAQIISLTSAEITDATTLGRELLTAPDVASAQALLGIPTWPFPVARNTIAAVGDSMTARNAFGQESILDTAGGNTAPPVAPQSYINPTYLRLLPILTHQRIREGGGMYAVSNSWVTYQKSVQLPYVLAMDPLPGACVLACDNAEILDNNTSYSFSANQGFIKSMVAQLLAVGVVPILWTIPPINSTIQVIDVVTINVRLNQWNVWIRRYAAENGFPLIDAHTALAQVDGSHIPGTVVSDLLHPDGPGHILITQQAIADGLADWFPPNSLVNTARTTDDLTNLFNDGTTNLGLFTSNTSGVGTGLTATGTATFSVVSPASTDELLGNWQQITVAAGNNAYAQATLTGWSVGDTLAYSCRVQTENMANSNAVYSLGLISDAAQPYNGIARWGDFNTQAPDIDDGELYFELEIPSGITSLKHRIWIQSVASGSATLRAGEVTIRNLTTGGFLV